MTDETELLRLCYNENALGTSPKAAAAMAAALEESHLYPDGLEKKLVDRLAEHLGHGITAGRLVVGNGCSDVLRMIVKAFLRPGDEGIIAENSFLLYERFINASGGKTIVTPMQRHTHDLDAMQQAITDRTRLIFICNPNNPTGTYVGKTAVSRFLQQIPEHIIVVLDEAYIEFTDAPDFPDGRELILAGHNNVIATRTFSKIYGMAGLRVGYGIGAPEVMTRVSAQRLIFNNSRIAYLGALAALDDTEHVQRSVDLVKNGRRYFQQAFAELGYECLSGQGNFVYVLNLPIDASALCTQLEEKAILLRPANGHLYPHHLRVTIGRPADNRRVIDALKNCLARSV